MQTFSFEPLIAPALWIALAVMAVALLVWYGMRRPKVMRPWRWVVVMTLMSAGVGLVLAVLLNPTLVRQILPPAGKPQLTVLLDASASMATPDAAGGGTRYKSAVQIADQLSRKLSDQFDVRLERFSTAISPTEVEALSSSSPDGRQTDVASAITVAQRESPIQGQAIVLLSDGIHNAGGGSDAVLSAVRMARAMSSPIYTRTLGGGASVQDVKVELRSSQDLAFIGQKIPITALVRQVGLGGGQVVVTLSADGKELDRQQTVLAREGPTTLRFQVQQDKAGVYRYEVRSEPYPGEMTLTNNSATYMLRVMDEPIRVLLIEGKPYWDGKFLLRTLALDPCTDASMLVRVTHDRVLRRTLTRVKKSAELSGTPPRHAAALTAATRPAATTTSRPAVGTNSDVTANRLEKWEIIPRQLQTLENPDELQAYQIVVLGRDAEDFLTEGAIINLRNWIARKGGSLVCYRGVPTAQTDQRLSVLMPVRWSPRGESRYRVRMTDRGEDLHWLSDTPNGSSDILAQMPSLAIGGQPQTPKPLAVVLATAGAGETPVVSYQPYGTGRVVALEGAGMWRWAFLPPQFQEHDDIYGALWQSLLRWLVSSVGLPPGQNMALRADKVSFNTVEPATATLLLREDRKEPVPAIELRDHQGQRIQSVAPAALGDEPGVYRVVFGKLPAGAYQAVAAGTDEKNPACKTMFEVRSYGDEELDLQARPDLMARIAAESGGVVLKDASPAEIAGLFQRQLERNRPDRIERSTIWDQWWVFGGILLVWSTAWALRRSGGLT